MTIDLKNSFAHTTHNDRDVDDDENKTEKKKIHPFTKITYANSPFNTLIISFHDGRQISHIRTITIINI